MFTSVINLVINLLIKNHSLKVNVHIVYKLWTFIHDGNPDLAGEMATPMMAAVVTAVLVVGLVMAAEAVEVGEVGWRIHTLFSVECQDYFDWQTVGLMHSFRKARQPGPITRLLSCTPEERARYRGMGLAPTLEVPSMSRHPQTGDW